MTLARVSRSLSRFCFLAGGRRNGSMYEEKSSDILCVCERFERFKNERRGEERKKRENEERRVEKRASRKGKV